jgi:hypothetical protein
MFTAAYKRFKQIPLKKTKCRLVNKAAFHNQTNIKSKLILR